ncbi:MAG: coenzyme F420-0:L-glutamate ligase [Dethiobacteria bacterium]|jgi:F420-0:gamma-glutamyl ligase|nr:hypothetical protein [Bacillota bacterium]
MTRLPSYIGPAAFGVKMGVILPGTDLVKEISTVIERCWRDQMIDDGDVLCITESVVARAQNNYVTIDEIARQIKSKLKIKSGAKIGVLFPIVSRNRFAMILKGIARSITGGEVVVQLSYPTDEVGNHVLSSESFESLEEKGQQNGILWPDELVDVSFTHPITGVNYIALYQEIIEAEGAKPTIFLSNEPQAIADFALDGLIVADIHKRHKTKELLSPLIHNVVTLQDFCSDPTEESWSEWGLLGSNMSAGEQLKLAPRNSDKVASDIQKAVKERIGKKVEVIIYGDGAYRDPTSGIYELADPRPAFGATKGLHRFRKGFKYKYLADKYYANGSSAAEIEEMIAAKRRKAVDDELDTEGTTPRRMEDILASLADLVSGSADAGTPLVIVKGFLE